ncbi:MAG: VOC family protein [Chitinophagales bacterium]|nr:VOC family protein [Chitinophagales bacterium]
MYLKDAQFVIYVKDISKSRKFYSELFGSEPSIDKPNYVEIPINNHFKLGIVSEESIVRVLGTKVPHPMIANGIPRNEIYLIVDHPEVLFEKAIKGGAEEISRLSRRSWGHLVAYAMDFDGNVLAFADSEAV